MAENTKLLQIRSLPGIKRDGTRFEGDAHVDGQWVRWQRGYPRKIGGYHSINKFLTEVSTALCAFTRDGLTYIQSGSPNMIEQFYLDMSGNTSIITDRTPVSGFTASDDNLWDFDVFADSALGATVFAQVAPNLTSISNSTGGELFYAAADGTAAFAPVSVTPTGFNCTGGVVSLFPYLFVYGNDGYVAWSVPGTPTDFTGTGSGAVNITSQKIVAALPLRGGPGNSPSGLFWSLDSLIRGTFVGGDEIFQFDTLSTESTILSPASAIEYDGIYYWLGTDRFLMFNGVVREMDNPMNINYFFEGLNYNESQKVFAMRVPRFGEIWWCYPRGDATECSHAIIYNVRENSWYDTELPNGGRSAAVFPPVFGKPLMTGVQQSDDGYKLWVHETGVDEIDGQTVAPVYSFYETADLSMPVMAQENRSIHVMMIEPDFVQTGDMTVQVKGRANAKSPEVDSEIKTIYETPSNPHEQVVYFKTQRRELRFKFASNVVGGDYQAGLILAHLKPGDDTVLG